MNFWSTIKHVVTPTLVSGLRVVSSAGFSLFGTLNFFKALNREKHPARLPIAYLAIIVNILTTLTTRVPSIFRQFRQQQANIDNETEVLPCMCPHCHCCQCLCDPEMGAKAKGVFYILKGLGLVSASYASLSYYLGSVVLSEFIANELGELSIHENPSKEALLQTFAILCALANFVSWYAFQLKKMEANAKSFAKTIDHGDTLFDKDAAKTMAVSLLSLTSTPFLAYYSTTHALAKIPFIQLSDDAIQVLSVVSAITSVTSALTSDVPSLYHFFKTHKERNQYTDTIAFEPYARYSTYCVGAIDAITSTGMSTFVSIIHTLGDAFKFDPQGAIIIPSFLCALSKTILGYTFSVRQGYLDAIEDYHQNQGHIAYQIVANNEDGGIDVESQSKRLYGEGRTPFLFQAESVDDKADAVVDTCVPHKAIS